MVGGGKGACKPSCRSSDAWWLTAKLLGVKKKKNEEKKMKEKVSVSTTRSGFWGLTHC